MKSFKNQTKVSASSIKGWHALQISILTAAAISLNLSMGLTASAADITGMEDLADFGTLLNQNTTTYVDPTVGGANVGPNACVPTAVAQGLSYLEGYAKSIGSPDPFTVSPNNMAAINNLASAMGTAQNPVTKSFGTTYPGRVNGTQTYLSPAGANPSSAFVVGGQYDPSYSAALTIGPTSQSTMQAVPTANFLANGLNAHQGVEFALLWGNLNAANNAFAATGGGHFVTLQAIDYNPLTGTGQIDFIDPGTGDWIDNATLTKTAAGNLYVTYPAADLDPMMDADNGEAAEEAVPGQDMDGVGAAVGGIIINDLAEATPDSASTAAMLVVSLLGLAALRRHCLST